MRKAPFVFAVALLSLGGCVAGGYEYAAPVPGYAPYIAPGYDYPPPAYAPPLFFGDAFLFQFGGHRDHRYRDYGGGGRHRGYRD